MGERLIPAVLKTVVPERVPGVRIPLPPPICYPAPSRSVFFTLLFRSSSRKAVDRCRSSIRAEHFAGPHNGNLGQMLLVRGSTSAGEVLMPDQSRRVIGPSSREGVSRGRTRCLPWRRARGSSWSLPPGHRRRLSADPDRSAYRTLACPEPPPG